MTGVLAALTFAILAQTPLDAPPPSPAAPPATTVAPEAPKPRGDGEITVEIESKFVSDKFLSPFNINTNTSGGVVTLTGSVDDNIQRDRAEELALQTRGVNSVINNLIIVPKSYGEKERRSFRQKLSDRGVSAAVRTRLVWYREPRGMKIGIKTVNGVVTLSGIVRFEEDREKIERTVAETKGVVRVINNLIIHGEEDANIAQHIGRQASDEWYESRVKTAISANKHISLRDIDVEVQDGVCILTGTVNTEEERALAEDLALSIKGVTRVRNEIALYEGVRKVQMPAESTVLDAPAAPGSGLSGSEPPDTPTVEATELPAP